MSKTDYPNYFWDRRERRNKVCRVPFGYTMPEPHCEWFEPDHKILDALEYAKDLYQNGSSSRTAVDWLKNELGEAITHTALIKRIESDNKRWNKTPPTNETHIYGADTADRLPQPRVIIKNMKTHEQKMAEAKTRIEKELLKKRHKLTEAAKTHGRAKTVYKRTIKKLKTEGKEIPEQFEQEMEDEVPTEEKEEGPQKEIVFQPNPGPQEEFLSAWEREVFYGGAKGGGKSYALLADPLRYFSNKNFRGLIIRRTMNELRDLMRKSRLLYPKAFPRCRWKESEKMWTFPSGATLEFGYADSEADAERYRGQSYTWIGIDELPQYKDEGVYNLLKSCLRSTDPSLPTYIRSTGNPGNIGSQFVKKKFIDPAPPNTTFYEDVEFIDRRTDEKKKSRISMRYIPATIWDNPYLVHDDSYVAALSSLPEVQRRQMLEGDWDVVESGAFPEFSRSIHVIKPFNIPSHWPRIRAADWGYQSPFSCLWGAVSPEGRIYIYREFYGKLMYPRDWAETIADEEIASDEFIDRAVIDGSTDAVRAGEKSIMSEINEVLRKKNVKIFGKADRSPGSRATGKQLVHSALALTKTGRVDADGKDILEPNLFIFNNCVNLIRTLPELTLDKLDPEKVAKGQEDHGFDSLQYLLKVKSNKLTKRGGTVTHMSKRPQVLDPVFGY